MGVLVKAPGPSRPPWEGMGGGQCGAWQGGVPRTPDPCGRKLSFFPGVPQAGCSEVGGCKALIGCLLGDGGEAAAVGGACRLALGPLPAGSHPGGCLGQAEESGPVGPDGADPRARTSQTQGLPARRKQGGPCQQLHEDGGPSPRPLQEERAPLAT